MEQKVKQTLKQSTVCYSALHSNLTSHEATRLNRASHQKNPTLDNKQMKPAYISSLSFLPVLATFKHNFLARSLLSAYKCRGYLHDDVTSKFTGKKESGRRLFVKFSFIRLAYFPYIFTDDSRTDHF